VMIVVKHNVGTSLLEIVFDSCDDDKIVLWNSFEGKHLHGMIWFLVMNENLWLSPILVGFIIEPIVILVFQFLIQVLL
jgi:hypothetical protein